MSSHKTYRGSQTQAVNLHQHGQHAESLLQSKLKYTQHVLVNLFQDTTLTPRHNVANSTGFMGLKGPLSCGSQHNGHLDTSTRLAATFPHLPAGTEQTGSNRALCIKTEATDGNMLTKFLLNI